MPKAISITLVALLLHISTNAKTYINSVNIITIAGIMIVRTPIHELVQVGRMIVFRTSHILASSLAHG